MEVHRNSYLAHRPFALNLSSFIKTYRIKSKIGTSIIINVAVFKQNNLSLQCSNASKNAAQRIEFLGLRKPHFLLYKFQAASHL